MKWITLVLCAIVAMIVVACGDATRTTNSPAPSTAQSPAATTASATPDQFAAARAGYAKNCLGCHGETGEGGTKKVEGKTLKVPSFKAPHSLKDSDKEFMEQIHEGGEGMPAFKDKLSEAEMTDLVKFIRNKNSRSPSDRTAAVTPLGNWVPVARRIPRSSINRP